MRGEAASMVMHSCLHRSPTQQLTQGALCLLYFSSQHNATQVFVAVEREFEVLWEKYIKDKNLQVC